VARRVGVTYRYELRRGSETIATGHMSSELTLEVGQQTRVAGHAVEVRSIEPLLGERELRLVLEVVE